MVAAADAGGVSEGLRRLKHLVRPPPHSLATPPTHICIRFTAIPSQHNDKPVTEQTDIAP